MMIIGCDLHTRYQQIAMLDTDTGEVVERRLEHENGEAQAFYAALTEPVRVGIEATGHTQWFEPMLGEMGHELWVGDAAQMRAMVVRKQKTDTRDAAHVLDLLVSNRFPRIWRPSWGAGPLFPSSKRSGGPAFRVLCEGRGSSVIIQNENLRPGLFQKPERPGQATLVLSHEARPSGNRE